MTQEILDRLLENIKDIDLIKRINEQDDYIINNISEMFSQKSQEKFILGNISIDEQLELIKKALISGYNPKEFAVLQILDSDDIISNRNFNQISLMCDYINFINENNIDLRVRTFTNKDINEYVDFDDQIRLFYDDLACINGKLKLISMVIHECKDSKDSPLTDSVIKLILNQNSSDRLIITNEFLMDLDRKELTMEDYYNIITTLSKPPVKVEEKKKLENKEDIDALERPLTLYQRLCEMKKHDYTKGILESFKNGSNIDIGILRTIDQSISDIDDVEVLESIYDVCSYDKLNEKIDKEKMRDIVSLMCKLDKYNCRNVRSVFRNDSVVENRSYNEMLEILREIFNDVNNDDELAGSKEVLLNSGILKNRSQEEALYLLSKLRDCNNVESRYIMSKLAKLEGVISKVSFEEQKEEIELITKIDNTEIANMLLTLLNNRRIISNRTFEERKQFAVKILEQENLLKLQAVYDFIVTYSNRDILDFDTEMKLADYISNISSPKEAFYTACIFTNATYQKDLGEKELLLLLEQETTGIERIDEIKRKLELTKKINSSSNVDELINISNISEKHYA